MTLRLGNSGWLGIFLCDRNRPSSCCFGLIGHRAGSKEALQCLAVESLEAKEGTYGY